MRVEDIASRSKQEKSKKLLFESLKNKTAYYLNKPTLDDSDLYYYVKDFLREYLDISSEISFGELIAEIDKTFIPKDIKENLVLFIRKIGIIEYKDDIFDEETLRMFVKEFYKLAKTIPGEDVKLSYFNSLLQKVGIKKEATSSTQFSQTSKASNIKSYEISTDQIISQEPQNEMFENAQTINENANKIFESKVPEFIEDEPIKIQPTKSTVQKTIQKNEKKPKISEYLKIEQDEDFTKEISALKSQEHESNWLEDVKLDNAPKSKTKNNNLNALNNQHEFVNKIANTEQDDIYTLISKSKNIKNKDTLIELYKRMNVLYEQSTVKEKAKIYPELLTLYTKISKG